MIFSWVVKKRAEIGSLSSLALSILLCLLDLFVVGSVIMGMRSHCTLRKIDGHVDLLQNRYSMSSLLTKDIACLW